MIMKNRREFRHYQQLQLVLMGAGYYKYMLTTLIRSIFAILFFCSSVNAATIIADTCESADIQDAIDTSVDGDTVTVPAGNCTWTSSVNLGKGITLSGAGIDQTTITSNVPTKAGTSGESPLKVNVTGSSAWRITGFTFTDTGNNYDYSGIIEIKGSVTGWRLDHVKFYNCNHRAVRVMTAGCEGLIDHIQYISDINEPTGSFAILVEPANSEDMWDISTSLGDSHAIYIEDSTFSKSYEETGGAVDGVNGARYVFRHNHSTNMGILSHGREHSRGTSRFEAYDNIIDITISGAGKAAITWRGGTGIAFDNTVNGDWWQFLQLKDYSTCDSTCDNSTYTLTPDCYSAGGYPCQDQVGRAYDIGGATPQALIPIIFFGNTYKGAENNTPYIYSWITDGGCTTGNCPLDGPDVIQANRDYYVQNDSFNGTSGVGVGTSRPSTCTQGVYYWHTDTEVLDKCTSTNTWQNAYFKPYTYPHPLAHFGSLGTILFQ